MEYLTPEDFIVAEQNGISRDRVLDRYYDGWSKNRAITQPVRTISAERAKYREIAEQNGISNENFSNRIRRGWTLDEASTIPLGQHRELPGSIHAKLSKEQIAEAERNGIPRSTLFNRVYTLLWPVDKAITVPVNKKHSKIR